MGRLFYSLCVLWSDLVHLKDLFLSLGQLEILLLLDLRFKILPESKTKLTAVSKVCIKANIVIYSELLRLICFAKC